MNLDLLSKRELQVLKLAVDGLSNRQIAEHLTISIETAKHHTYNIYSKVGCDNRTELASWWYTSGEAIKSLQAELDATKAELATLKAAYRALQKLAPYGS